MAVRFPCPTCGREMFLEPVHEGFEVPCPHCGARFLVPPGSVSVPAAAPGAPEEPRSAAHTGDAAFCGTPLLVARAETDVAAPLVPPPRRPPSASDGSLQLVFGVLGIVGTLGTCVIPCVAPLAILAPVAWWFGHRARAAAKSQGREPAGSVTAGWVLGIIGTGLIVLSLAAIAVFIAVAAAGSR